MQNTGFDFSLCAAWRDLANRTCSWIIIPANPRTARHSNEPFRFCGLFYKVRPHGLNICFIYQQGCNETFSSWFDAIHDTWIVLQKSKQNWRDQICPKRSFSVTLFRFWINILYVKLQRKLEKARNKEKTDIIIYCDTYRHNISLHLILQNKT